jgi:O-antigen ligase
VGYFGVFDVRTVAVSDENWALVERMAHWQAGAAMFLAHPWLGVGAGNYAEAYPDFFFGDWTDPLGHAHNFYLNTLAELGVVGLGFLLLFLGVTFGSLANGVRRIGQTDPQARVLVIGLMGGLAVFCLHNVFDNLFVHGVNVQIGILIGLAFALVRGLATEEARGA